MDSALIPDIMTDILELSRFTAKSLKTLAIIESSYSREDPTVTILVDQLSAIKAAIDQVNEWVKSSSAHALEHNQLLLDIKESVDSGTAVLLSLENCTPSIAEDGEISHNFLHSASNIWEEPSRNNFISHLEQQVNALKSLLASAQCQSIFQRISSLQKEDTQRNLRQAQDSSSSMPRAVSDFALARITDSVASNGRPNYLNQQSPRVDEGWSDATRTLLNRSFRLATGFEGIAVNTEIQQMSTEEETWDGSDSWFHSSDSGRGSEDTIRETNNSLDENTRNSALERQRQLLLTSPIQSSSDRKRKGRYRWPFRTGSHKNPQETTNGLETSNLGLNSKIFILGAGSSGKTTLLKSLERYCRGTFDNSEKSLRADDVLQNIVDSMRTILEAREDFGIPLDNTRNEYHALTILMQSANVVAHPDIVDAIQALWQDSGIQRCFKRSREYQLLDSAAYYFENVERIVLGLYQDAYVPTDEDFLRLRVRTTGLFEQHLTLGGCYFKFVDTGGERSERGKWSLYICEQVGAMVFVVDICAYDLLLWEDESVNRMNDQLALFDHTCNHRYAKHSHVILLFTKTDMLGSKLNKSPLKKYMPDFSGGKSTTAAKKYFSDRFTSLNKNPNKQVKVIFSSFFEGPDPAILVVDALKELFQIQTNIFSSTTDVASTNAFGSTSDVASTLVD